jgi:hypothetical protein
MTTIIHAPLPIGVEPGLRPLDIPEPDVCGLPGAERVLIAEGEVFTTRHVCDPSGFALFEINREHYFVFRDSKRYPHLIRIPHGGNMVTTLDGVTHRASRVIPLVDSMKVGLAVGNVWVLVAPEGQAPAFARC